MTTLTPERALAMVMTEELCRRSFVDFLDFVQIRSDDPLNPTVTKWQAWPYLTERARAWESGRSEVVLKARQLGFSWLSSAYVCWRARNGWSVALISKGQDEARALLERVRFIELHLPEWMQDGGVFRADDAIYPGGGFVKAFPSTPDAGVSYTFQLVLFDELAFHPYGSSNYAAIRPTLSAGGQFLAGSTADPSLGPSGFMHDLYYASKRGDTGYDAVFVPWNVRPGRDAAWLARERAAYTGHPEEFDAYYPETDAAAFVGKSGLVYPMFTESRHIKAAPWEWAASVRKVAGVDFGGGDPTAVAMLGMSGRQHVHQFAEFYKRGPVPVDEIAGFIAQHKGPGRVMCDPSQAVAIATLAQALAGTGWDVMPADNRRGDGIGMVAFLLENDRLTIEPSCRNGIAEFPGYRWSNRVDPNDKTRYATSTPVDNHADGHDSRRYAAIEITALLHDMGAKMPTRSLGGRPLAKQAV